MWPDAIDLLHALAPSERDAVATMFAAAPTDFAHATWHRLRIAVDLVAGTDAAAGARAQLRTSPPAAFALAMAHGSAGQRIELLRSTKCATCANSQR